MWIHIGIWEIRGILRVSIQTYVELCGPIYLKTSCKLQEKYQEPCVVFAGYPSLRSGAAINFIRKWGTIQII